MLSSVSRARREESIIKSQGGEPTSYPRVVNSEVSVIIPPNVRGKRGRDEQKGVASGLERKKFHHLEEKGP